MIYILQDKCFKSCGRYKKNCSTGKHDCPLKCFEKCPPCDDIVKKQRTKCGHIHQIKCCENVDALDCTKRCNKIMECGHKCLMDCYKPCGNCKEMVFKLHI